jgi:hypothetical protein
LTNLTKKGQSDKIIWKPEHEKALTTLKQVLALSPILRLLDLSTSFVLQCDASDTGVEAALLQQFDEGLLLIAYARKKLLNRERNYSVFERKSLAMVFEIKKLNKYVNGKEFELHIDHAPLTYSQKCKFESGHIVSTEL